MSGRETPGSTVWPLPEPDDLVVLEDRIERLLTAPIDADATWALVDARIGGGVVQIRRRRRSPRILVLGVAAALVVSGVAFAAVTQRVGLRPPTTEVLHPHIVRGPAAERPPGSGVRSTAPTSDSGATSSLGPVMTPAPSPSDDGGTSPGTGAGTGSGESGQQGDQGESSGSTDPTSTQDPQQGQSDQGDGGDTQGDASPTGDGDQST